MSLNAMEWSVAHHYYVPNANIDVNQMRLEAMNRIQDNRHPEHCVIHFHAFDPNQGWCINDGVHEQYRAGRGKVE
jgi:hypothetical protein